MFLGPLLLVFVAAEPAPAAESEAERPRTGQSQPAPTLPPLVPVDSDSPDAERPEYPQVVHRDGVVCVQTLSEDGRVVEACRADPAVAKATKTETELAQLRERGARVTVPSRVGVVAVAGAEGTFATDGSRGLLLRPRVGVGLRVALTPPAASMAVPSLALVGGYAGLLDHRLFAELRAELLVPQAMSMLMPGFTAYALGGFDALLAGGLDPYVGVGVGWDHNIFAPSGGKTVEQKPQRGGADAAAGLGGLGSVGYIFAPVVVVAIAFGALIGFICAGRVEFRYHAGSSRSALPLSRPVPTVSVLFGFGI